MLVIYHLPVFFLKKLIVINEFLLKMAFENILFALLVTQQNKDATRRLLLLTFSSGLPKDLCMRPSYQKKCRRNQCRC